MASEGKLEYFWVEQGEGIIEGEARGETRGEAKRNIAIAKNMLHAGIPVDTISQITGLSIAEITALK